MCIQILYVKINATVYIVRLESMHYYYINSYKILKCESKSDNIYTVLLQVLFLRPPFTPLHHLTSGSKLPFPHS